MKKIIVTTFFIITSLNGILLSNQPEQQDYPYGFFYFLPDASLIKKECNLAENKKKWPFKGEAQKNCERIEGLLRSYWCPSDYEQTERALRKLDNFKVLKDAIRVILENESVTDKWRELEYLLETLHKRAKYEENAKRKHAEDVVNREKF